MKIKSFLIFFLLGLFFISLFFVTKSENRVLKDNNRQKQDSSEISIPKQNDEAQTTVGLNQRERHTREEFFVSQVIDGDTLVLKNGQTVRLLGINAPEKEEPFFKEATEKMKNLVAGKKIWVEKDVEEKDRYGRALAYVFTENIFINEQIVISGYAVSQTIQPNVKYQDKILEAERDARRNCSGMWEDLCNNQKNKCIKIAEINADARGNDNLNKNGEWVRIKNDCKEKIDLKGWILRDSSASNRYSFKDMALDAGKFLTIFSGCGEDSGNEVYWKCPEQKYAVWNNSGDHIFLINANGEIISDLLY